MRKRLAFLVMLLASCNTPGPEYRGAPVTRVTVGQSTFDIRIIGNKAQAIRVNTEWAPRPMAVMPRALTAIEQVSQCHVRQMDGDQVVIEARLKCGGSPPPRQRSFEYECDVRRMYRGHARVLCEPGL